MLPYEVHQNEDSLYTNPLEGYAKSVMITQ
jgi:hypothetical protein